MLHFFMYFAARLMFICDYDPLQMGKFVYTIESKCKELPEYEYHDGVHTIFLSTKGKNRDEVEPELLKFLDNEAFEKDLA